MTIETLTGGPAATNSYLVADADGVACVIDPGYVVDQLEALRDRRGWVIAAVVATHGHFDHVAGCAEAKERWAAPLWMHPAAVPVALSAPDHAAWFGCDCPPCPRPEQTFAHGDRFAVGALAFEVRHTPGHSPGGVCLVAPGVAIVGDTLFAGSIGRFDLPHSDGELLMKSIAEQLMTLPDETRVYPGHGEPTTIGAERRTNPFRTYFGVAA